MIYLTVQDNNNNNKNGALSKWQDVEMSEQKWEPGTPPTDYDCLLPGLQFLISKVYEIQSV